MPSGSLFGRLVFFCLMLVGPPALAANCLNNFLSNERWSPHALSAKDLRRALNLSERHGVSDGWAYLAQFGDTYAGLASIVTREKKGTEDSASPDRLVHRHWQTVVGAAQEDRYFYAVARRHFRQYLSILETGTWPDSNQILLSYLSAVRSFQLPDELVFDAAWLSSKYSGMLDWRAFNILSPDRWASSERVCLNITQQKADHIIETDFSF